MYLSGDSGGNGATTGHGKLGKKKKRLEKVPASKRTGTGASRIKRRVEKEQRSVHGGKRKKNHVEKNGSRRGPPGGGK